MTIVELVHRKMPGAIWFIYKISSLVTYRSGDLCRLIPQLVQAVVAADSSLLPEEHRRFVQHLRAGVGDDEVIFEPHGPHARASLKCLGRENNARLERPLHALVPVRSDIGVAHWKDVRWKAGAKTMAKQIIARLLVDPSLSCNLGPPNA